MKKPLDRWLLLSSIAANKKDKPMNSKTWTFFGHVMEKLLEDKVSIHLISTPTITFAGSLTTGYFDDDPREFRCAMAHPEWLWTFTHEFNHYNQWKEDDPKWNRTKSLGGDKVFDDWLQGNIQLSDEKVLEICDVYGAIEHDCEARTIETIKEWDLDIPLDGYARNANSYVYFYGVLPQLRKWTDTPPYRVPQILETMPTELVEDFKATPEGYLDLVKEYCYGSKHAQAS